MGCQGSVHFAGKSWRCEGKVVYAEHEVGDWQDRPRAKVIEFTDVLKESALQRCSSFGLLHATVCANYGHCKDKWILNPRVFVKIGDLTKF